MNPSLVGAWKIEDDTRSGLALFSAGYFSFTTVAKDRQRYDSDELSDAQAAEAFRTLGAAAGSYEVDGAQIICRRMVNRHPNWHARAFTWPLSWDGEVLQLGPYRATRLD